MCRRVLSLFLSPGAFLFSLFILFFLHHTMDGDSDRQRERESRGNCLWYHQSVVDKQFNQHMNLKETSKQGESAFYCFARKVPSSLYTRVNEYEVHSLTCLRYFHWDTSYRDSFYVICQIYCIIVRLTRSSCFLLRFSLTWRV